MVGSLHGYRTPRVPKLLRAGDRTGIADPRSSVSAVFCISSPAGGFVMARRPVFIARQGRRPSGLLGQIVARVMAHETARDNAKAIDLLDVQPTDRVLDIGTG